MTALETFFSKELSFEKWHGAENDFLFVSLSDLISSSNTSLSSERWNEFVVALCHRHTGLGADGVVVWTHDSAQNRTAAAIWNSDGSRAQTCGNALRCLAGVLLESALWQGKSAHHVHVLDEKNPELTQTNFSSPVFATLLSAVRSSNSGQIGAAVSMGGIATHREGLLAAQTARRDTTSLPEWMRSVIALNFVQLANPHLVVQLSQGAFAQFDHAQFCEMGRYFQSEGVCRELGIPLANIGFIEPSPQTNNSAILNAIVYERGAGLTQCCGSGGCAMRVALKAGHSTPFPDHLKLKMPGGVIEISESENELILTGPAKKIARLGASF
jgi:diaminopimelate epimerase